jgi:hypothetical protein
MTASGAIVRFRIAMIVFIVGLLVSGIPAFSLLAEMKLLTKWFGVGDAVSPVAHAGLESWILTVKLGLEDTYARYPWIAYGTDWLAFGHIAIALLFVGPVIRPSESRLVLYAGVAACILVPAGDCLRCDSRDSDVFAFDRLLVWHTWPGAIAPLPEIASAS